MPNPNRTSQTETEQSARTRASRDHPTAESQPTRASAKSSPTAHWVTVSGVTEQPDPERLLAEALRAQAVRAPVESTGPVTPDPLVQLLSGADQRYELLSGRASDTIGFPTGPVAAPGTTQLPVSARPVSGWWIVLLAILLGLAAGAVVGLISIV